MILDGKDIVAMARTGSGKTAAFLVPMFERLKAPQAKTGARAIIMTPTRELALQTMKFTKEVRFPRAPSSTCYFLVLCRAEVRFVFTVGKIHRPEDCPDPRWRQVSFTLRVFEPAHFLKSCTKIAQI